MKTVTVDDGFEVHAGPGVVEFNFSRKASDRCRNLGHRDENTSIEYFRAS